MASGDFTIKLWHLPTGQLIDTLTSHLGEVRCIAFGPDGQFLASGGDDLEIWLWAV